MALSHEPDAPDDTPHLPAGSSPPSYQENKDVITERGSRPTWLALDMRFNLRLTRAAYTPRSSATIRHLGSRRTAFTDALTSSQPAATQIHCSSPIFPESFFFLRYLSCDYRVVFASIPPHIIPAICPSAAPCSGYSWINFNCALLAFSYVNALINSGSVLAIFALLSKYSMAS